MERCSAIIFLQIYLYSIIFSAHINSAHQRDVTHNTTDGVHWDVTKVQHIITKESESKVNITVYYETLCPASINFFIGELRPTVQIFRQHLNVHLVPYGHAETRQSGGRYTFRCQHGYPECYGNMLHACAIDVIQNNTHAVLFTTCLMEYSYTVKGGSYTHISVLNWCAYTLDVDRPAIAKCMRSDRGSELLKSYGEETHSLRPRYVPFILLNDSADQQDQAEANLIETICQILIKHTPHYCSRYLSGRA